ncbi:hypothetical protein ACTG4Q_38560 (plasmid) [Bradyrhizobium denitrificans]
MLKRRAFGSYSRGSHHEQSAGIPQLEIYASDLHTSALPSQELSTA